MPPITPALDQLQERLCQPMRQYAFVPLILVRELQLFMSAPAPTSSSDSNLQPDNAAPSKPIGYTINVFSCEGLFEDSPDHRAKDGHHVHTNMSKAALNMLTETEAAPAWKNGRVVMNTVDPVYMSVDLVFMEKVGRAGEPCPIGWEDGAARALWPVAQGEKGHIIRGRFLKHFSEAEAVR
ncbi:hypothetical protein NLJ89_g5179 [Agrocybe chaxingu]|uniref:Uncharacterized protein n=1 Tax=Agrocybe chaxingu TaxID=84603 RepID=A0A9W8K1M0_9AGAR|nr:hypothetical protein NLJ89_g5179 [Agrocybe chaxingu]